MMKYAVLDTDFISKTHTVRINDEQHLIDCILTMPDYLFCCHEQTLKELSRHNSHAPEWLERRIREGCIIEYTDEKIIDEMTLIYRDLTLHRYNEMLKAGCDSFDADYYANYFSEIGNIDTPGITKDEFLLRLRSVEDKIGEGKNLGEIKCYVLLQWLNLKYGNQLYYFCSDDKDARNGVLGIEDIGRTSRPIKTPPEDGIQLG